MLRNFDEMKKRAAGKGVKTIAVAAAEDPHALEALKDLKDRLDVRLRLVGDRARIAEICAGIGLAALAADITDADGEEDAAAKAVALVAGGEADILMKGKLQTAALLKAVLNKETGIRSGELMSHLAVLESPGYDRLMFITDGGMNPCPDAAQKKAIIENTVAFMRALGYERPNVAALAAVETVSEKMPETVDADRLAAWNREGAISGCVVEGPLSFDLAASRESAEIKGAKVGMAGETDVFLAPNISAGNIMSKSLL